MHNWETDSNAMFDAVADVSYDYHIRGMADDQYKKLITCSSYLTSYISIKGTRKRFLEFAEIVSTVDVPELQRLIKNSIDGAYNGRHGAFRYKTGDNGHQCSVYGTVMDLFRQAIRYYEGGHKC